jgi:hypothetical protein
MYKNTAQKQNSSRINCDFTGKSLTKNAIVLPVPVLAFAKQS